MDLKISEYELMKDSGALETLEGQELAYKFVDEEDLKEV